MFPTRRITTSGGDVFRDEFSLAFDGTDDYIELSGAFNYTNHAIVSWVKITNDATNKNIFDYRDGGDDGIFLNINSLEKIKYEVNTSDVLYDTSLSTNVWHHIVATNDGSNAKLYLNGIEVGSSDSSGVSIDVSSSAIARIGARSHTSVTNYFKGNMSEVVIYNKGLSASEVKTLYNGREPYNHKEGVCSSNLQGWWRMGDGVLDGIANYTGNNNDHPQVNIISDETDLTLGSELYTPANSLSNNEGDQSTGFSVLSNAIVAHETSIVSSGSSRSLKYTSTSSTDGIVIDLTSDIDLTEGKVYKLSIDARHIGTGGGNSIRIAEASNLSTTGDTLAIATLISSDTTFQTYTAYFVHNDTTTRYFGARETAGSDDGGLYLDNLSIKEFNGNAGIMLNMDTNAFKGDTP